MEQINQEKNSLIYSKQEGIDLIRQALYDMNSGLGIEVTTYSDSTTESIDIDAWIKRNL